MAHALVYMSKYVLKSLDVLTGTGIQNLVDEVLNE